MLLRLACKISIGLTFLSGVSCIDQLDYPAKIEEKILVVEGFISTEPGPHTIAVSLSARYGSVFEGLIHQVKGANVTIRDNEGIVTELNEIVPGYYQTPQTFHAVVGKSYSLQMEAPDGQRYFSIPEQVVPVTPIDTLFAVYKRIPSLDKDVFRSGVEVWSRFHDPEDTKNYSMWKTRGTYQINTRPDLFEAGFPPVLAPKECCATCWIEEARKGQFTLFTDFQLGGQTVNWPITFVEDDGGRFMEKYLVRVARESLTKEAYQFYKLLEDQLGIEGNIFDPPPATIRGNIINIDDPNVPVIGYFRVSDVDNAEIYIRRDVLEEHQTRRYIRDDCRILKNSTTEQPSYWK